MGWTGFVKSTAGWYVVLITKSSVVALIGGHYLYHLEGTDILPIALNHKVDNLVEEQRLLTTFRQVDMTKNLLFSNTYDITSTLQHNLTRVGANEHGLGFVGRFAWNHRMLAPAFGKDEGGGVVAKNPWATPIMHGHVDEASTSISFPSLLARSRFSNPLLPVELTVLNRVVYVTIVACRSLERDISSAGSTTRATWSTRSRRNKSFMRQVRQDSMDHYRGLHAAKGSWVRGHGRGILVPSMRVIGRCVKIRIRKCDSTHGIDGC